MLDLAREQNHAGRPDAVAVLVNPRAAGEALERLADKLNPEVAAVLYPLLCLADKALDDALGNGRVCPAEHRAMRNAATAFQWMLKNA